METKIIKTLQKNPEGLSLSELTKQTGLTKDQVRIGIARLEGAQKVKVRDIGTAKLVVLIRGRKHHE